MPSTNQAAKRHRKEKHMTAEQINTILDANTRLGTVADLTVAAKKAKEELVEFCWELQQDDIDKAESELGDAMLAMALLAGRFQRQTGRDPTAAAAKSAHKVSARLEMIESEMGRGATLGDAVQAAKAAYP